MWVVARRSCHQPCVEPWSCAIATAGSPAATDPTPGAMRTTSCTGRTAVTRPCRTSCCCVAGITAWSTTASGSSCSTAGRCSGEPTGRCWRIGRRRSDPLGFAHHAKHVLPGDLREVLVCVTTVAELFEQRRILRHVLEPLGHLEQPVEIAPDADVI